LVDASVEVLSRNLSGGTEEISENSSEDSWSPVQNLKPGPPKYKSGLLILNQVFLSLPRYVSHELARFATYFHNNMGYWISTD
jgi:hypothetical protein